LVTLYFFFAVFYVVNPRRDAMPIISAEIPEIIESVIRPIVFDITRNILSRTGIGKEASVLLNKDGSEALQLNSALGSISTDVKFDSKEHIRVSMEEEYSEIRVTV